MTGLLTLAAGLSIAGLVASILPAHWHERYERFAARLINADHRKVGGLHFIKIGRLTVSVSLSRAYRPIGG